jgi:putative transposase
MRTDPEQVHRDWRMPDALWVRLQRRLPPRKLHPWGCPRPRVDARRAMDAIFFVLRPGCQWNARHATGLCASRSAHRRVQEWTAAGVFLALWTNGLVAYAALNGIDWEWLALDGAMTKAPLGGKTVGKTPTDRGEIDAKRRVLTDGGGGPLGLAVEGAKRNDCTMVAATLLSIPSARPTPPRRSRRGGAGTKAMTMTRAVSCGLSSGSRLTFGRGGKRPRRSSRRPD